MAMMMAPFNSGQLIEREVTKCAHCKLVQFLTGTAECRRCKRRLNFDEQTDSQSSISLVPRSTANEPVLQVACAIRDLRHVRNLSQRQLASRACLPRTYISKMENGKAMPTLSCLDRLARALNVEMSALLRDANTRHSNETSMLVADPFLAEIAAYTSRLGPLQRSVFLNHVQELARGRKLTKARTA